MALLRILSFPSTTHQSPSLISLAFFQNMPQPSTIVTIRPSSLSVILPNKNRKPYPFYFSFPYSIKVQATAQTSEPEQSETTEEGQREQEEELEEEEEEEEEEDEASRTRLYAQNVPWTCTPDDLRPLFEKYGTVVDIDLAMYNKTRNRGLAFVTMSSHEEATAALNNLESYEFEGRAIKLYWARPKKRKPSPPQPKPEPIHNLFVANLSYKARAKDLKEFFKANNANVVSADIIFYDNPRRSSGYGFVSFDTKAEADAALSAFQGKDFMGRPLRVARSRRFRRQETKENVQSASASNELNHKAEDLETDVKV